MNWQDLSINIGLSIVTGIISGVYTGLVMAKFTSFCQARLMIVTICRGFSAGGTNGVLDCAAFPREEEIVQHACTLLYLGHKSAGGNALQLSKEIGRIKYAVEAYFHCKMLNQKPDPESLANITLQEVFTHLKTWQEKSMKLQPSIRTLLSISPKL